MLSEWTLSKSAKQNGIISILMKRTFPGHLTEKDFDGVSLSETSLVAQIFDAYHLALRGAETSGNEDTNRDRYYK